MPRQNARLDKWQLSDSEILFEQRVHQRFLFSHVISLNDEFAACVREFHCATFLRPAIQAHNLKAVGSNPTPQPLFLGFPRIS
jgi:hypothetical protein